jgi:hypothetical protein
MKILIFSFILMLMAACDPLNLGYKNNPAYILDKAFESIANLDSESFVEISGKEALCLYGNSQGLFHLKERLEQDISEMSPKIQVLSSKHFEAPEFVGYWSYFNERYLVSITEKKSKEMLLEAIIDCDYGTSGEKSDKLKNLNSWEYSKRECRLIKVMPKKFPALGMTPKCKLFEVKL